MSGAAIMYFFDDASCSNQRDQHRYPLDRCIPVGGGGPNATRNSSGGGGPNATSGEMSGKYACDTATVTKYTWPATTPECNAAQADGAVVATRTWNTGVCMPDPRGVSGRWIKWECNASSTTNGTGNATEAPTAAISNAPTACVASLLAMMAAFRIFA